MDECLTRKVLAHVEFRADVSSRGDRSKFAMEDHSNCVVLVNRANELIMVPYKEDV